jgi:hypothetical protein
VNSDRNLRSVLARWLSRLSFSFLIVALVIGWDARQEYRVTHALSGRMAANIALVAVFVVLAVVGTALRHRRRD